MRVSRELWPLVKCIDLLQNNIEELVREKRRVKRGRLGGDGEAPAHRRRQIWPVMLAG
jgi:hypothetical protein